MHFRKSLSFNSGYQVCQTDGTGRDAISRTLKFTGGLQWIQSLALLGCLFPAVIASHAHAQISTANVNGTVKDSTGAVIYGAAVTLTNSDTGVQRATRTTDTGNYSLVEVPPGNYGLTVEKQGFTVIRRSGITLTVNLTLTINVTLPTGSVTQTVTTSAVAATIDTSTAANGTVIGTQMVQSLPLNGRNFTELLTLTPGATSANVDQNASNAANSFIGTRIGTIVFPGLNGEGNRSNIFVVDGLVDQSVMGSEYAVAPIIDDIQEFKVQSLNDESMYGGVTGGIINVVTKSGTNNFHGAGWEFLRNDAFDASNPFVGAKTKLRQNQFGGNIGGPVRLPRYNGKNKTFFFLSYEQFKQILGGSNLYTVPTASELAGDLSDQPYQIYNPFTTTPDPANPGEFLRTPFPNNQIPKSLIDPGMIAWASIFPAAGTTVVPGYNAIDTTPTITQQYEGNGRINEQINDSNAVWFRYSRYNLPIQAEGSFKGLVEPIDDVGWNYGASYLHTFNSTTLVQVQIGRTYDIAHSGSKLLNRPSNIFSQIGFANSYVCAFTVSGCLLPEISITGFLSGGEDSETDGQSDYNQYSADFTKIVRNHTIKIGYGFFPTSYTSDKESNPMSFESPQTANLESPGNTGSALASFLLGVPVSAEYRNSAEVERGGNIQSVYVEDQWRATRKLTINVGLRYDLSVLPPYGLASNQSNAVGNLNMHNGTYEIQVDPGPCVTGGQAPCIPGGLPQPNIVVSPNGKIFNNQYDNIQPRIGAAYAVNAKTVVHGGFGIYFDNWANFQQLLNDLAGQWPEISFVTNSNLNANVPTVTAENPLPGGAGLPPSSPFQVGGSYADPEFQNIKSTQWIFGVERQLSSNTAITVNYVGNKDSRLWLRVGANTAPAGPGAVATRVPYPYILVGFNYDTSLGSGDYNALQVGLRRSYVNGLSYNVAYTWSKAIDVGCTDRENCSVENPYDLNAQRSVSSIDQPQILSASVVYDLPFGANRMFQTPSALLNQIIGDWRLNSILSLTSGLPYTLTCNGDIANTGNKSGYERLNQTGSLSLPHRSIAEWFNTANVAVPAQYTFGDMGRNALFSDWFKNDDLSIFRSFPIKGEKSVEFRAEMFNFMNNVTWGTPGANISDPHFGQVTSTNSTSREVQFALKIKY